MPEINPDRLCASARLTSPTDSVYRGNASGGSLLGFKRAGAPPKTKWAWDGPTGNVDGQFCFRGNLEISGAPGTLANPRRWSLYASGSVSISGDPVLASFDEDSILVAAGGDLQLSGNPVTGTPTAYSGALYARHQCEISGNPDINGQVLCDSDLGQDLITTEEYAVQNIISGQANLSYNCNNKWASTRRYLGWMQRQGLP
jgi:hypothetical protein